MSYWPDNPADQQVFEYIEALENGDFETLGALLAQAETSPRLWEQFEEVNEAFYAEQEASEEAKLAVATCWSESPEPALGEPEAKPDGAPAPHKGWSAGSISGTVFGLALLGLLGFFWTGKQLRSPSLMRPTPTRAGSQTQQNNGYCGEKKTEGWIRSIHKDPELMLRPLNMEPGSLHVDLFALQQNQHLPRVVARTMPSRSFTPTHRAIRARLYLRMARFHSRNYRMALSFSRAAYTRRLDRAKTLRLGRNFFYYLGRLQCLEGRKSEAQKTLKKALSSVPPHRASRVKAWAIACSQRSDEEKARRLSQLSFAKDPDGWSELILLHHLFHLDPVKEPQTPTLRAKLYARVFRHQHVQWPASLLRRPVDKDDLEEHGIKAEVPHFDPAVYLMMSHNFAQRAIQILRQAAARDRYAPFFRAEAYHLMGDDERARHAWNAFLVSPPKQINRDYLIYSHRLSPRYLQNEARYHLALLQGKSDRRRARRMLLRLAETSERAKALAGLGMIQLRIEPHKGYRWLSRATRRAYQEESRFRRQYAIAAVECNDPTLRQGAAIISQLALYRYEVRALYLWGSMGALLMHKNAQAARWMEMLHRKQPAYKIVGENQPVQLTWTARAYWSSGRQGVASLFFVKNLKDYPSLTQLWVLMRTVRIFEGMVSVPLRKG